MPSALLDYVISHASSFSIWFYTSYAHRCHIVLLPFYVGLVESQVPYRLGSVFVCDRICLSYVLDLYN